LYRKWMQFLHIEWFRSMCRLKDVKSKV
jgi:hypothetical protein